MSFASICDKMAPHMERTYASLANIRPDHPEAAGPLVEDQKYWSLLTESQRDDLLDMADRLIARDQIFFESGICGIYAIKPGADKHYPRLQPQNGSHTDELRHLILSNPACELKSLFEIPMVMTHSDVRDFYSGAPWKKMERNIVASYGVTEADLFIAYMTSDVIRFGVACDAKIDERLDKRERLKNIIEPTRAYLGSTSSKKAYDSENIDSPRNHSIRGMLGSPYFSENPARKFIFLNCVHFSSSLKEASREASVVGAAILNRLTLSY